MIPVAHMGHWLMGIGFAGPPLTVVAGVLWMAARERRREGDGPTPTAQH